VKDFFQIRTKLHSPKNDFASKVKQIFYFLFIPAIANISGYHGGFSGSEIA
jgi:hypothetical protein